MTSAYNRGGGYNEIVISARRFEEALPATIEAFVYLACDEERAMNAGRARRERSMHTSSLSKNTAQRHC